MKPEYYNTNEIIKKNEGRAQKLDKSKDKLDNIKREIIRINS